MTLLYYIYYIWVDYQQEVPRIYIYPEYMCIVWLFYFIIMPLLIVWLNKIEFLHNIFCSKRFFMLWIATILLGTICAILYFEWSWLLLLNIAATGLTTITLTLLPVLNTKPSHKISILQSLCLFVIFCIIFIDNILTGPVFIVTDLMFSSWLNSRGR